MPFPIFLPSRRAYAENEEDDGYIALLSEPEKEEKVNPGETVITTGWMTSVAPLTLLASAWAAHVEGITPKAPKAKTDELSMQEQARLLVEDAAAIDVFGRRALRGPDWRSTARTAGIGRRRLRGSGADLHPGRRGLPPSSN